MKALSVKQPWASLIASGEKTVECRSWNTQYRGELLICSSKLNAYNKTDHFCGKGLAVVDLVDVRTMTQEDFKRAYIPEGLHMKVLQGFAWILQIKYSIELFPQKGKLSFFEVNDTLIKANPSVHLAHIEYVKNTYPLEFFGHRQKNMHF